MKGPTPPRNSFGEVHFSYRSPRTPAQYERYWALQKPNPKHVAHLRAGITQFRQMLAARDRGR